MMMGWGIKELSKRKEDRKEKLSAGMYRNVSGRAGVGEKVPLEREEDK